MSPLIDASGTSVGDLVVMRDITVMKAKFYRLLVNSAVGAMVLLAVLFISLSVLLRQTDRGIENQQRELLESERRFDQLAEQSRTFTWEIDADGMFTYASRVTEQVTGYRPEEVIGKKHFYDLHPAKDREEMKDAALELLRRREPFTDFQCQHESVDGDRVWVSANGIPLLAADGTLRGYRGSSRDITQQKLAEESLNQLLHDMEDRIKELTCMYEVGNATRQCETVDDLFMEVVRLIPPSFHYPGITRGRILFEDRQYLVEPFERTPWKLESEIIVGGKRLGSVQVYYLRECPELDEGPFLKEERQLIDALAKTLSEAVERKRAEEQLIRSETRYRTLYDSTTDAVILQDEDRCIDCNEAALEMFGCQSKGQFLGVHPIDGSAQRQPCGTASATLIARHLALAIEHGGHGFEWLCKRMDTGEEFPTEVRLNVMELGGKQVIQAVIRDITERKLAEAELEKHHQARLRISRLAGMSEIATGILHNVGNVLNSVNVSIDLIRDGVKGSRVAELEKAGELVRRHLDDIGDFVINHPQGKYLPRYISEIGSYLAGEHAQLLAELALLRERIDHIKEIVAAQQSHARCYGVIEEVSMVDLIEDVLAMRSVSLEKHGITVIREFQEVPAMLVDRHKIMQIIYNLVENAVHALRDPIHGGGRITIRLYQTQDDRLGVEVEDNGIGIKRENLSQIFNFGFSTKEDGHGFGLHTSALAAIEMGGKITVHSDGEGQGATFCLQLRQWQGARGKECVPTG